jgi:hypothetical protein
VAWLEAATDHRTGPSVQLRHLRGAHLDVGDSPAALLRRPGDERALRRAMLGRHPSDAGEVQLRRLTDYDVAFGLDDSQGVA